MNEAILTRAAAIVNANTMHGGAENPVCVLTQIDLDGAPTAATITPAMADGLRWIAFCSGRMSNWAKRGEKDSRACVCFSTGAYNISLTGRLEIVTDAETRHAMWYQGMENHFQSADDPGFCVLRFTTERYNLLVDWQEARGTM